MIFRLFNWKVNAVNCSGYATFAIGEQTWTVSCVFIKPINQLQQIVFYEKQILQSHVRLSFICRLSVIQCIEFRFENG